jgi:hypothetical protein
MVGDECLFGDKEIIEYTAVTDTECDFYELEMFKLKNLIMENKFVREIMRAKCDSKLQTLHRRMKCYIKEDMVLPSRKEKKVETDLLVWKESRKKSPPPKFKFNQQKVDYDLRRYERIMKNGLDDDFRH